MSDRPYVFQYADLSHLLLADTMGVTQMKGATTENGQPVFVLGLIGDCACGEERREINAAIHLTMLADLVVELSRVAQAVGLPLARLDHLLDVAAEQHPVDPRDGQIVAACPTCRRAMPDCTCPDPDPEHVWAVR